MHVQRAVVRQLAVGYGRFRTGAPDEARAPLAAAAALAAGVARTAGARVAGQIGRRMRAVGALPAMLGAKEALRAHLHAPERTEAMPPCGWRASNTRRARGMNRQAKRRVAGSSPNAPGCAILIHKKTHGTRWVPNAYRVGAEEKPNGTNFHNRIFF